VYVNIGARKQCWIFSKDVSVIMDDMRRVNIIEQLAPNNKNLNSNTRGVYEGW
jgi:hypothetical protein